MEQDIFYRLGQLLYKLRWFVIFIWVVLLLSCIPILPKIMDPFKAIGFFDPNSESAKADKLLNEKLGYSYNRFLALYQSPDWKATDSRFNDEIKKSLSGLKDFPVEHQIIYPDSNKKQISKDKHTAYAVILFKSNEEIDDKSLDAFKQNIDDPKHVTMLLGGEPIFLQDTKTQTQTDLFKAEYIATPVAIITMLIVFGSVVAASLPIILGGLCAILTLTTLYFLGYKFSLSVFTINIALLLGLCLSLDYCLLLVSRFRYEIRNEADPKDAIAVTLATAGKAVFFSGVAVLISLSALLLFHINVLFSVGMGGLTAVAIAIAVAVILLPAILSVLNTRIDLLSLGFLKRKKTGPKFYFWEWFVTKVVKHPFIYSIINKFFSFR